jgi:hypothetical protein
MGMKACRILQEENNQSTTVLILTAFLSFIIPLYGVTTSNPADNEQVSYTND